MMLAMIGYLQTHFRTEINHNDPELGRQSTLRDLDKQFVRDQAV